MTRAPNRPERTARTTAVLIAVYALFFVFLSLDLAFRLWSLRRSFDVSSDFAILFTAELVKAVGGSVAVIASTIVVLRSRERGVIAFGFVGLWTAVWYLKSFAAGFPGFAQESIASALIGAGIPAGALRLLFGAPAWAVWLGLGAVVRLAALFPDSLSGSQILESGAQDRRGSLRSVALAGADVGGMFRAAAAWLLERGYFRWFVVVGFCATAGVVLSLTSDPVVGVVGWSVFAVIAGLGLTLVRANRVRATAKERAALNWLKRGMIAVAVAAGGTAVATVTAVPEIALFGFLMLSGPVLVGCLVVAELYALAAERARHQPPAPNSILR